MKEKFCIEIAGIQMTILSDEGEEFVNTTVAQLDQRIRDLTVQNKRCSKLDATMLCALDFLGEKIKNEKKIKNLEAQISLYEATIKRLREEAEAAQAAAAPEAAPVKTAPAKPDTVREPAAAAEAKPVKKAEVKAAEKAEAKPEVKPEAKEPAKAVPQAKAETKTGAQLSLGDDGNEKIRQIENLLRQRGENGDKPAGDGADAKNDKLRQIEDLLRKSGSTSLSDALKKADS